MSRESEPSENISGGFGVEQPAADLHPQSRLEEVVTRLGELYWRKTYGDRDAFACLVRTVLSQNTSDVASQPAYDALVEHLGEDMACALRSAHQDEIASLIEPAGLYNQKAAALEKAASTTLNQFVSTEAFDTFVSDEPYEDVRDTLLSIDGVGPKTADCVLLFAGGRSGVFPVDTHVHRIYRRLGIAPPNADHENVRAILEGRSEASNGVPDAKCGFGHTASIQFGREYCSAQNPACLREGQQCPLWDLCDRIGVNLKTGAVVDPAESVDT